MIGKTVGRFRVLEKLGQGGMATVWRAADELQGRTVALKLLKEELAEQPGARLRFEHEAKTASLLDHPSIAAVYDWGEFEGRLYLAMTYVDGQTVSELAKSRLLPIEECLRIVESAADALGHAHERGIIHRDVTARNIMVAEDGRVYVLDFGIALVADLTRLTTTGKVFGTAAYIAPELYLHQSPDGRSDLYSLGVVLYEALTGCLPFAGDRSEILAHDVLSQTVPPPSKIRPAISAEIDSLTLRLLSLDPKDRPASASELRIEINAALQSEVDRPIAVHSALAPSGETATGAVQAGSSANSRGLLFLGIPPFTVGPLPPEYEEAGAELRRTLAEVCGTSASSPGRVHVVLLPKGVDESDPESLRTVGREHGVNSLLLGTIRVAGTAVRVSYRVLDSESGFQFGGDRVEGSLLSPLELEDALARSVRFVMGAQPGEALPSPAPQPPESVLEDRLLQASAYLKRFDNEASVDGAISVLEDLVQSSPDSASVHATLARAYLRKYELTSARTWEARAATTCDRAIRMAGEDTNALMARGELRLAGGRWGDALFDFETVLHRSSENCEAGIGRIRALHGLGRSEEAESAARALLSQSTEDWRVHHELALILYDHGQYAEAASHWEAVTKYTPDNAGALGNLGAAYFRMAQYRQAEVALRKSIAVRPTARAYDNLGTTQFYLGSFPESVASFERAVRLNPSDPLIWGNLGNARRLIPNEQHRAGEALARAAGLMREQLDRDPGHAVNWARLADWLAVLGDTDEAKRAIERALELAPDNVTCLRWAGSVYNASGDRNAAVQSLKRAVNAGYPAEALQKDPDLADLLREIPGASSVPREDASGRQSSREQGPATRSSHGERLGLRTNQRKEGRA